MLYLENGEIIKINRILTSLYSQPHFVMSEANLDHVLERMQKYCEGTEDEKERLFRKAAYLLYHLTYDLHVFSDGNKRTALSATAAFLSMNGWKVEVAGGEEQTKQAALMKETAEGKRTVSYVCRWLKEVSVRA